MKFAIFSDIHNNVDALTAALLALFNENEKIDKLLIAGDIVGYGPNPNECCAIARFLQKGKHSGKAEIKKIVQEMDITESDRKNLTDYISSLGGKAAIVAGNHDKEVIGEPSLVGEMNSSASKAAKWTISTLEKANFKFLGSLGYRKKIRECGIEMVHSSPVYPQGWEYPKNAGVLSYNALGAPITFGGHTHYPAAYLYKNKASDLTASVFIPVDQFDNRLMLIERESYERLETFDIILSPDSRYYINPGSIGQARDGIPKASYMVYDTESKRIALKKAEYNTEAVKDKMIKAKLPRDLANRIIKGV